MGSDNLFNMINILDIIKMKIELNKFSESLYFSFAPVVGELRPQNGFLKPLQKPEYSQLKLAIEELIQVEKECWDKNCDSDKVKSMTKNYIFLILKKLNLILKIKHNSLA